MGFASENWQSQSNIVDLHTDVRKLQYFALLLEIHSFYKFWETVLDVG